MDIQVKVFEKGTDYTLSRVSIDGFFQCYSIEDEIRNVKLKGETCIPAGTYKVEKRYSPKFSPKTGHEMLWVKDVPGFQYILIHTGNTDDDTEGCLVVGDRIGHLNGQRAVLDSKIAYYKLYEKITKAMDKGEDVTITYIR